MMLGLYQSLADVGIYPSAEYGPQRAWLLRSLVFLQGKGRIIIGQQTTPSRLFSDFRLQSLTKMARARETTIHGHRLIIGCPIQCVLRYHFYFRVQTIEYIPLFLVAFDLYPTKAGASGWGNWVVGNVLRDQFSAFEKS